MSDELALTTQQQQELDIQQWLDEMHVSNPRARELFAIARDSTVPTLDVTLSALEASIRRQAVLDILPAVAESDYTGPQIRSILHGAMLMRTKVLDWATFNIVYNNLRTIRDEGLAQIHPNQYIDIQDGEDRSFLRMAEEEGGIPPSTASDIMTLGDIIFPYFEEELDIPAYEIWDRVNRTNLRAMVPILRYLINQVRNTGDARRTQQRVIDRAEMAMMRWYAEENEINLDPDRAAMESMTPEEQQAYLVELEEAQEETRRRLARIPLEDRVRGTARWLLENAERRTVEGFARITAARDEPTIGAYIYPNDHGTYTLLGTLTQGQKELLERVMRNRLELYQAASITDLIRIMERHANRRTTE